MNASKQSPRFSRGNMIAMAAALGSSLGLSRPGVAIAASPEMSDAHASNDQIPMFGKHQAGIVTAQQRHTYFAALDVRAEQRADVIAMLQAWTAAAERMTRGRTVQLAVDAYDPKATVADSGDAAGLGAQRLTITVGFGPEFFTKKGVDRFGIAHLRPAALVDLPRFAGDQLIEARTGGDISVQACADDPQVAFHAVRQLLRLASEKVDLRWVQAGFLSGDPANATPRNLMGFKDGTQTVSDANQSVWVKSNEPKWMHGGTFLVVRRIRIALEHWDRMNVAFQEQVFGREKASGAPLGMHHEFDQLPLQANDTDGNPVIAENAHVRLAHPSTNNGAQILRRGYSYNEGASFIAERWPPWRQAMEYDAGLLFLSYQRDPRVSFIPMFEKMSKIDMLNQFSTHTGSAIFACAGGVSRGEYIGQRLFT